MGDGKNMRKGRSLELLVEKLERLLANDARVNIESPKMIRDSQTHKLREHDVVLTFDHAHYELIVAIECKDRSRPVGVPDVEAFDAKCRHTGVNQGAIVSSSGFANTALEKASIVGIKCLELKEIEIASFLHPEAVAVVHSKRFIEAKCTLMINNNTAIRVGDDYDIFDPKWLLITDEMILNNIRKIENNLPLGKIGEERTESIFFKTENYRIKTHSKQLEHDIGGILIDIKYVYEVSEAAFTSRAYSASRQGAPMAEIATAKMRIGGEEKEYTLISKSDGTIHQFITQD